MCMGHDVLPGKGSALPQTVLTLGRFLGPGGLRVVEELPLAMPGLSCTMLSHFDVEG